MACCQDLTKYTLDATHCMMEIEHKDWEICVAVTQSKTLLLPTLATMCISICTMNIPRLRVAMLSTMCKSE